MKTLQIKTKSKNYNIYIGHDIISKINKIVNKENFDFKKTLIIVDKNVPKNFIKKIKSKIKSEIKIFYYNSSEKNKSFNYVNLILEILFKNSFE